VQNDRGTRRVRRNGKRNGGRRTAASLRAGGGGVQGVFRKSDHHGDEIRRSQVGARTRREVRDAPHLAGGARRVGAERDRSTSGGGRSSPEAAAASCRGAARENPEALTRSGRPRTRELPPLVVERPGGSNRAGAGRLRGEAQFGGSSRFPAGFFLGGKTGGKINPRVYLKRRHVAPYNVA
jgi:hypothetical protein